MAGTAVLAVHYQNENCHAEGKVKLGIAAEAEAWREETLAAAGRLLAGARRHGVPLIHVRLAVRADFRDVMANAPIYRQWQETETWIEGTWGAEFLEGLGPEGDELVVTHARSNAFYGSPLGAYLDRYRPTSLVIAGVSTAYAVDHATRHAADLGYRVTIAHDACQTGTREQHDAALTTLAMFAEIKPVDEIIAGFASGA
jgi:nicotinamidase-related amidase